MKKCFRKKTWMVMLTVLSMTSNSSNAFASPMTKIDESSIGKVITVKSGQVIQIKLNSTFWTEKKSSNLIKLQAPIISAVMPGPSAPKGCTLPGMGCGTITWTYKAPKSGTATFLATRTSCGEALRCTASNSNFLVRFKVKP